MTVDRQIDYTNVGMETYQVQQRMECVVDGAKGSSGLVIAALGSGGSRR